MHAVRVRTNEFDYEQLNLHLSEACFPQFILRYIQDPFDLAR